MYRDTDKNNSSNHATSTELEADHKYQGANEADRQDASIRQRQGPQAHMEVSPLQCSQLGPHKDYPLSPAIPCKPRPPRLQLGYCVVSKLRTDTMGYRCRLQKIGAGETRRTRRIRQSFYYFETAGVRIGHIKELAGGVCIHSFVSCSCCSSAGQALTVSDSLI